MTNPILESKIKQLENANNFECCYLVKPKPDFCELCYLVSFLKKFNDNKVGGSNAEISIEYQVNPIKQ
ncbi:MAG: hypothetical protein LBE13_16675 [Bacteroidales bacterium]|jgi:hypothetical protein|nr:hypothetical protein [Bacteroidales bacterium]